MRLCLRVKVRKATGRKVDGGSRIGKIEVLGGAFPLGIRNGRAGVPNAGEDEGIGSPVAILKRSGCRGVEASILSRFQETRQRLRLLGSVQKLKGLSIQNKMSLVEIPSRCIIRGKEGTERKEEEEREREIQNSIKSKTRDTRTGALASSFSLFLLSLFSLHSAPFL